MKTFCAAALIFAVQPCLLAGTQIFESADTQTALIELFSSEGCSSCPPAEEWVSRLKSDAGLWKTFVPVVFHVDYWDNLGWPDRFASRDFTDRQRRYAAAWRGDSIYTPGFVLNGGEWRDRSRALPAQSDAKPGKLRVTLRDATHADVSFTPVGAVAKTLQIEIALLGGNIETDVRRGENGGRKLHHDFVVLHFEKATLAADGGRFTASVALPEKTAVAPVALAAWVTGGDAQPVIQATGGWLKN